METFKRRFSIDAPVPFSAVRRKSEPVFFDGNGDWTRKISNANPGRRYSTSMNTPVASLHGLAESNTQRNYKYSSNREVRKLSLSMALQEAVAEEYGYTPIYGIPIIYTPPPDTLYTSTCFIVLTQKPKKMN